MMKRFFIAMLAVLTIVMVAADGKIRVYVTRHGQPGNHRDVTKTSDHYDDPFLTELGEKQAHCLGKFLKQQGFKGKIFASPILRTVHTAVCIGDECGLLVRPDARFQEVAKYKNRSRVKTGYTLAELNQVFPGKIDPETTLVDNWILRLANPERTTIEQKERLMKGLDEVMKEFPGQDLLFVGHAGSLIGWKAGFQERMGVKIKSGSHWNCALLAWDIDLKTGAITYVGYRIDFMTAEMITNNRKDSFAKINGAGTPVPQGYTTTAPQKTK